MNRRQALAALGGLAAVALRGWSNEPDDGEETVRGDTRFALDLYGQLKGTEGNLFLSPYSISSALAMTYVGARGNTAEEMAKTLRFTLPHERLHPAYGQRLRAYTDAGAKRPYQLHIANALWGQAGMEWRKPFIETTATHYQSGLREVNFSGATEQARKTINEWVEQQTKDKIKDLIKPGLLNALTRMVLTNAIYFKGNWVLQFDKKRTADGAFFINDLKQVNAKLMTQKGKFNYMQNELLQAVEMPYAGKELSMVVLLPRKRTGLAEVESKLSMERLNEWTGKLQPARDLTVTLPKFTFTAEFELSRALQSLGMQEAFSGKADLSGMAGNPGDLRISKVIHKAFVDVNEEGTEAAAATAVVVEAKAVPVELVFRADHPFLFLIREVKTGAIMFMGRMSDPSQ